MDIAPNVIQCQHCHKAILNPRHGQKYCCKSCRTASSIARSRGSPKAGPPADPDAQKANVLAAQSHAPSALATVVELMQDEDTQPQVRLAAANTILDRAFGRPKDTLDVLLEGQLPQFSVEFVDDAGNVVKVNAKDEDPVPGE